MRTLPLCSAVFLAVAMASYARADTPAGDAEQPTRIVLIGDSHVEALGPRIELHVKKKNTLYAFKMRRGTKASDWTKNKPWTQAIIASDPQVVVISLGTNEGMGRRNADQLAATFQKLVDCLSDNGQRMIFWVTPPYLDAPKNLLNVWSAIGKVTGAVKLDFSNKTYPLRDGTHLTSDAYELWAWDIAKAISPHL